MSSSRIWRRMDLVRTNVSEERVTSVIRVKRISELGTLAVTSKNLRFGGTYHLHHQGGMNQRATNNVIYN
jgi:hypothetical protein